MKPQLKTIFYLLTFIAIYEAIHGQLQLLGYLPSNHNRFPITGWFMNPGPYSGFLAILFPIALSHYLFFKDKLEGNKFTKTLNPLLNYIPIVTMVAILLVLPAARSRAAWLAVIVSSVYLFAFKYNIYRKFKSIFNSTIKRALVILTSVIFIVISMFVLYKYKQGSADGRVLVWKVASQMIKDKPILGHGYDGFKANYMEYQANYFKNNPDSHFAEFADNCLYAFNEFVRVAVEFGLLGLGCVILLLIVVFFHTSRKLTESDKKILISIRAGILALIVFSMFSYPMSVWQIKVVASLYLIIWIFIYLKTLITSKFQLSNISYQIIRLTLASLLIGSVVLSYLKISEYKSYKQQWDYALMTYQMGDYSASIDEYKRVHSYFKEDGEFLINYGKALSMAKKHKQSVEILTKAKKHLQNTVLYTTLGDSYKALGNFKSAEKLYQTAANMVPAQFYPLYLLAKLYKKSGQNKKAIKMATELLNKKVKIQSTAIEEIKDEMRVLVETSHEMSLQHEMSLPAHEITETTTP